MDILIYFFTYTFILIIGFIFGYLTNRESVETTYKKTRQKIFSGEVGIVRRPSAEKLRKRGTLEEETEKAMEETLEKILV